MCHDLSIGFRDKVMVLLAQVVFQIQIVFDDSVVNYDHAAGAVTMRVRILFGRSSVRRPASVADAISSVEWLEANPFGHNDPRYAPVGNYLFSPLDEDVERAA